MKIIALFVLLINILIGGILYWLSHQRIQDFQNYHQAIAIESTIGVATNTAHFIREKKRLVNLFAKNELPLIRQLVQDPENEVIHDQLSRRIMAYFPDYFTFTLSDTRGEPYFEDFDGLIGEACRNDLTHFAEHQHPPARIHPNYTAYHFDVMSDFGDGEGILFISFHPDILSEFLKAAQTRGHQIILALSHSPSLIEVTTMGARDTLDRTDFSLSTEEKSRILHTQKVSDTAWESVDLEQPGLFSSFRTKVWQHAVTIFSLFFSTSLLFFYVTNTIEARRKKAEQSRDEFLSAVSHELRTPLTAIRGALGLIESGVVGEVPEKVNHLSSLAIRNTLHMTNLINDLLDLRKLESGDFSVNLEECDITSVVNQSLDLNREYGSQLNVKFKLLTDSQPVIVYGDRQRLLQVMSNLLSNAAKYGATDSTVDISINTDKDMVVVAVKDYGDGIPKSFHNQIFDKFSQANMKDNKVSKGTGLGLSIVKHIIELHNGHIDFNTEEGEGTTFYFNLPILRSSLSGKGDQSEMSQA